MLTRRQRLLTFAAVGFAIAVVVVFVCLALSVNYNYCVGHNGQHATSQYNQEGSPIIEPPIARPTAVNLFVHCGGIYANENGAGITAASTVLLMGITFLLGIIAYRQYETSRSQLRAYVAVNSISYQCRRGSLQINMSLKNWGQTPATDVRVGIETEFSIEKSSFGEVQTQPLGSTIPPSGQAHPTSSTEIEKTADWVEFSKGKTLLFAWGVVTYKDAFGRPWETPFRFMSRGGPDYKAFVGCDTGNEAT